MVVIPLILTDNVVPTTFDCVLLAVRIGLELSVAVHVTAYKPTRAGVKTVVDPLVVLNSLVLVDPSGRIADQLKEYGSMPPVTLEVKFCGFKLEAAEKPVVTFYKSEPVIPISADEVATKVTELASVTLHLTTFKPA